MNITWPKPGRYVLAVSGGADSMTLLHLLATAAPARGYELVVAHFDHGLRPDSAADAQFVRGAAKRYNLPCAHHAAHLGQASEAVARSARHLWLETVRLQHDAAAIVTGHHQDDLLETSLLNLARGTGRRGLAPMHLGAILRPMLRVSRAELRAYAAAAPIAWREDSTNADQTNPRNFLRHRLLAAATPEWRARYLGHIDEMASCNERTNQALQSLLAPHRVDVHTFTIPRAVIRSLSLPEIEELLLAAARSLLPSAQFDRRLVQELALFALTAPSARRRPFHPTLQVVVRRDSVTVLGF